MTAHPGNCPETHLPVSNGLDPAASPNLISLSTGVGALAPAERVWHGPQTLPLPLACGQANSPSLRWAAGASALTHLLTRSMKPGGRRLPGSHRAEAGPAASECGRVCQWLEPRGWGGRRGREGVSLYPLSSCVAGNRGVRDA